MISFLLPIYNYNVVCLVKNLTTQAKELNIPYEVLAYDDCSTIKKIQKENEEIAKIENVQYVLLNENHGRSKIRNLLARESRGEWLLFLDCDSKVNNTFIYNYLQTSKNCDCDVICGGTEYQERKEIRKEYLLHWTNGKEREYHRKQFTTNNFFIKKEVFNMLQFNENLSQYGHEDTLFGIELKENNYKIAYIDNPVTHLGLKNTDKFINDTILACENLKSLYNNNLYRDKIKDLSLVKAHKSLEKYHLRKLYLLCFSIIKPICIKQLHSSKPILTLLDLLKLYYFTKKTN
ncbi:MAG: glycosyltransferase [Bacteroidales bacterium]|nr:glycosyltransferase [Bacteroidales bacterium]